MRNLASRCVAISVASLVCLTNAAAQRPVAARSAGVAAQQPAAGAGQTSFSIYGGIATGDELDIGFALQASVRIVPTGWPVAVRIDPYFARHSGDLGFSSPGFRPNADFTIYGVAGHAEYTFRTTQTDIAPFVLGGLGFYHGSVNVDFPGGYSFGGDDNNLGFSFGGGLRFAKRFVAELQFKLIDEFDTVPVLVGIRF